MGKTGGRDVMIGKQIKPVSIEVIYVLIRYRRNAELEKEQQARVKQNETIRLKILFWCISPLIFLAFLRLYWMLFQFVYGTLLIILLGKQFAVVISATALITSIVFTVLTFKYIYKQYKKHIVER